MRTALRLLAAAGLLLALAACSQHYFKVTSADAVGNAATDDNGGAQGVVFIDGYWDCPFSQRGVVFAPIWFSRPSYLGRGFCYTPSVVIDVSHLLMHLFVHPRRCHYYWGDYYGHHPRRGHHFYASFDYHGRHGYDPVFAYYHAYHRHRNIDYTQRLRGWHDYFRDHKEYRPPHTLHGQAQFAARVERNADLEENAAAFAKALKRHIVPPGSPDHIGHFATYLASDEAEYVTGSIFSIDGGANAKWGE